MIENDQEVGCLLVMVLEEAGYQVETAADTCGGLDLAKSWEPDLILLDMDINLRDRHGFLKQLKAPRSPQVPVVILAADEARQTACEAGADGWLTKPFDLDVLLSVVRRHSTAGV